MNTTMILTTTTFAHALISETSATPPSRFPIIFLTKSIIDTIETQVFASKSADQKQYPTDPKQ